jgi:colanic acid/amylovoran biosynthesis glycosyltransferase
VTRSDQTARTLTAVVNDFPAPSETFILRKLGGLRDAGVRIDVAAASFGSSAHALGFGLVPLAPWRRARSARTSAATRASWRAIATSAVAGPSKGVRRPLRRRVALAPLESIESEIVHFEFSGIAVTYLDALDALRRRSKVVVSCRGAAEQVRPLSDPSRAALLAEVFDAVDLIHCVSEDMRATVTRLGAPPEKIFVNRPAVPVADFRPLRQGRREDQALRVLSIGRLHWKKGLDDGLRAIAALRDRGRQVSYRIVGEGPEREKLSFMRDQLGLAGTVELAGSRSVSEVVEALQWADVLLLPSLSEGISNAALEAMAAGLPVISTECGGMSEVITHDHDGLLVGVGDVASMVDHLDALAARPDVRSRLGAAAATRADAEFDVRRQVDTFLRAYSRLLDR